VIDTHCHLLHGLDDGPATVEEAVLLARALVADGIEQALCTPHYSRLWAPSSEETGARFAELKPALEQASVPLEVGLAAEVGPGHAVTAPLEELKARAIGGRYLLVEVQADTPLAFFGSVLERLAECNLVPVFAHPERARGLRRHPAAVDEPRAAGALVQVVAPSLLGRWGSGTAETGWRLLDHGRVDLLASDTHGLRKRRVHLREAGELVARRLGEAVRDQLTRERPQRMLAGS
jgi:protein-tyrosine phosphatase